MLLSKQAASDKANAVRAALAGGLLRVYSTATPPPTEPDQPPPNGSVLMAECLLGDPIGAPAADGVLQITNVAEDPNIRQTGALGWAHVLTDSGAGYMLLTVGETAADIIVPSANVTAGRRFRVLSWAYTQPR